MLRPWKHTVVLASPSERCEGIDAHEPFNLSLILLSLCLLGCTNDEQDLASQTQTDSAWSKGAMVSAGNPYASEASWKC